jgi:Tissue inhibitor of metalloproteinase
MKQVLYSWPTTLLMVVLSSLQLPILSLACRCMQPTLNTSLYMDDDSIVMAGEINDEIKLDTTTTNDTEIGNRFFTFTVKRVYKGPCSIQASDTIIVSTSASTASCGLNLQPDSWYTFSAFASPPGDGALLLPSAVQVHVGACAYHAAGDEMSRADRLVLRKFERKKCTTSPAVVPLKTPAPSASPTSQNGNNNIDPPILILPSSPPTSRQDDDGNNNSTIDDPPILILPGSCTTGSDCANADDGSEMYCNAATGTCHPFIDTCGTRPTFNCLTSPCSVAVPCEPNLICIDNYCGGCNAIFLNADHTQVLCNNPLPSATDNSTATKPPAPRPIPLPAPFPETEPVPLSEIEPVPPETEPVPNLVRRRSLA